MQQKLKCKTVNDQLLSKFLGYFAFGGFVPVPVSLLEIIDRMKKQDSSSRRQTSETRYEGCEGTDSFPR